MSVRFFFKEINTFIQQGCINLIKTDSKDIYNVKKISVYINVIVLNFLFTKKSWNIMVSTKIFSSSSIFNIDNNKKHFLSSKSAY